MFTKHITSQIGIIKILSVKTELLRVAHFVSVSPGYNYTTLDMNALLIFNNIDRNMQLHWFKNIQKNYII